jgi:hypothetical protein
MPDDSVSMVAAGFKHSVCCTKHGTVYTWGDGGKGALGHGDKLTKEAPTRVEGCDDAVVTMVAAGFEHTAVVGSSRSNDLLDPIDSPRTPPASDDEGKPLIEDIEVISSKPRFARKRRGRGRGRGGSYIMS